MVREMKRLLLAMTTLLLLGSATVCAAENDRVYDDAGLLTEAEMDTLHEKISDLEAESGWNVYAITTDDAAGKSATAYADDFFDEYSPEQEDGVALLIDMDHREITISTCGEAIRYLTDARINSILDDAYMYVSEGDYGDCLLTMVDGVAVYYQKGIPEGQYSYDAQTGEVSRYHQLTPAEAGVALLIALVCGILVYTLIAAKYTLRFGTASYDFRANSRLNLRIRQDQFVNQTVIQRRIPKQTGSGGGGHSGGRSSTHHSSSGRSHGGGSRRF